MQWFKNVRPAPLILFPRLISIACSVLNCSILIFRGSFRKFFAFAENLTEYTPTFFISVLPCDVVGILLITIEKLTEVLFVSLVVFVFDWWDVGVGLGVQIH